MRGATATCLGRAQSNSLAAKECITPPRCSADPGTRGNPGSPQVEFYMTHMHGETSNSLELDELMQKTTVLLDGLEDQHNH